MTSRRTLTLLLALYAACAVLDWAGTSAGVSAGWVHLNGTGLHEGNPVAQWLFLHSGMWAVLGYKLAGCGGILTLVAGIWRLGDGRPSRWLWWGLGVATGYQMWCMGTSLMAVLAHRGF